MNIHDDSTVSADTVVSKDDEDAMTRGRKRPLEEGGTSSIATVVRVKKEKAEAERERAEAEEERDGNEESFKNQMLFTDFLQSKIDELRTLAEAAGADRSRVQEIIARRYGQA